MSKCIIGGIEGGATHSHLVLLNSSGNILATATGPSTNHYIIGKEECCRRIVALVNEAKKKAGISLNQQLAALGLSLSGCENKETSQQLVQILVQNHPDLSEKYSIASDTEGSVASVSNCGGVTCIAGTGSNTLLINPDGARVQCGGWGYLLGDEGSAWKIAQRSIKICFEDLDNFEKPPFSTDRMWETVKEHFQIENQADILDAFYSNFCKAHIASLCKRIAELANDGDKLAQFVFEEAGEHLARSILAVTSKAHPELTHLDGGIHIVCVGSVWLSWNLLKPGFVKWIRERSDLKEMSLLRLTCTNGVGAAYMAADHLELPLIKDYTKNYTILYRFIRNLAGIS